MQNSLEAQAWICPKCFDDHSQNLEICPPVPGEHYGDVAKQLRTALVENVKISERLQSAERLIDATHFYIRSSPLERPARTIHLKEMIEAYNRNYNRALHHG